MSNSATRPSERIDETSMNRRPVSPILNRRATLAAVLAVLGMMALTAAPALADGGGGGGGSNSGSGNSGSGSSNSGKGSDNSGKGGDSGKSDARDGVGHGDLQSVGRIIASARQAHPGQVLALNLRRSGSAMVYDVKILDRGGSVVVVRVDARTAVTLAVRGG
jgi:hypothetical protein